MKILCLHGYGTSPDGMKHQMSALMKACDPTWDFHFLAGKVICPPAPGIEHAVPGPYLCYSTELDPVSMRAALVLVKETFDSEGPFDGVFGFSQGAGVLLAYLLEQMDRYPEKPLPVQFGIFCSAIPMIATDQIYYRSVFGSLSTEDEQRLRSGQDDQLFHLAEPARTVIKPLVGVLDVMQPVLRRPRTSFLDRQPLEVPCVLNSELYKARLPIPTLHVRARNDPQALKECSMLAESFCLPKWRRSFEHSAVHSLPRSMNDVQNMVSAMRWVIAQGQRPKL